MRGIEIHLAYASVVWLAAWLLTSLDRCSATTKYWIWIAASVNFVLPLVLIPASVWPSRTSWFTAQSAARALDAMSISTRAVPPIAAVWCAGTVVLLVRLSIRLSLDGSDDCGPAVAGILRPRISLPHGIERILTRDELDAVVAHERTHARRRDNLIRLVHELTVCVLWFHPFVWLTRSKLALYREMSCDESVPRDKGPALVSALAKLAIGEDAPLLRATAASFLPDRIGGLLSDKRASRAANVIVIAVFLAVLAGGLVGPIAEAAAEYTCVLTHHAIH